MSEFNVIVGVIMASYLNHGEKRKLIEFVRSLEEKQIPKRPLDIITSDNEFICMICPSCQKTAVEFNDKYCRCCGQALDWSEQSE